VGHILAAIIVTPARRVPPALRFEIGGEKGFHGRALREFSFLRQMKAERQRVVPVIGRGAEIACGLDDYSVPVGLGSARASPGGRASDGAVTKSPD